MTMPAPRRARMSIAGPAKTSSRSTETTGCGSSITPPRGVRIATQCTRSGGSAPRGQRRNDVGAVRVVGDQRRARRLLVDVDVDQAVAQHLGRVIAAGEQARA